jgi:anti-anti-sigma factor
MQLTLLSSDSELLDEKGVVRVSCQGEISRLDPDPAREPLRALLGALVFGRKVLLNLEKATYIDSSGVSWLVVCHKHFVQAKGELILYAVPPLVFQVLELMRLPLILPIAPDEAAARILAQGGSR